MTRHTICVTAGQRSGTHAFRRALVDAGGFADIGEIFNTATLHWPGNFFTHCRERNIGFADVLTGYDTAELCQTYMAALRDLAGQKHLLFDVKFNSWGEIRGPWTYLHQEPYFLGHLKANEAKIVFIWRRDIVAQVISDRFGAAIGKWHNVKPEHVKGPVVLDVDENRRLAEWMCQSELYFWNNLKAYPNALLLCYEDLFENGGLSPAARAKVSAMLGESLTFRESNYFTKNEVDLRGAVTNYREVADAIAGAAAHWRGDFLAEMA